MQIMERKYYNDRLSSVVIDGIGDRQIRSRNFGGVEKRHPVTGKIVNGDGNRNFLLYLAPEIADELAQYGCEIRMTNVQGPNDVPEPFLAVTLSYYLSDQGLRPAPEVISVTNGVPNFLDKDHVKVLNDLDISNMCLTLEISAKEKEHQNGIKYHPVFATGIIANIASNYVNDQYGYLRNYGVQPATATQASMTAPVGSNGDEIPLN